MDHEGRIRRLQAQVGATEADGLLVTNLTNVQYLTGFTGTNAQLLILPDGAHFFSDGRYAARAAQLVQGAEIHIYADRLSDELKPQLQAGSIARLGIESTTMTVAQRDDLAGRLPDVHLVPTSSLVEKLRRKKEPDEIAAMRRAVELGDETFTWIVDRLSPGRTEREIALDIEMRLRTSGAEAISFDPIVGSGPLSAHIHHTPTERKLEAGDLVLLDFGCKVDGYCSDLTRTVVLGSATEEHRHAYDLVLAAHLAGIEAVAPDVEGPKVDLAARQVIDEAGRGSEFGHGLGHGVGLQVHEAPRLSRISGDILAVGDVVTVEPGVYKPGWGGIRIEDCVLVTEQGREVLGGAPKDRLIEI